MDYIQARVATTTAGADLVSEALMAAGALGTAIEDRQDVLNLDRRDGLWDLIDESVLAAMPQDVLVTAYFPCEGQGPEALAAVRERLGQLRAMDLGFDLGSLALHLDNVREEDWAENWKQYYKPFRVGKRLVVKPTWEPYTPQPRDLIIEMDPGMAFGTGTHETTSLCLEMVEKYLAPGMGVIDVGTGSGILAIAAAKLGAAHVLAIDLDEAAVGVARENVDHNGLSEAVTCVQGDLLKAQEAKGDLVIANIIADVIMALAVPVKAHLVGARLMICSGIIKERAPEVRQALEQAGYTLLEDLRKGEWACMVGKLVPCIT